MENYLPPAPEPNTDQPAVNAYRSLGMMALLDIDYWEGASEDRIEDYYGHLLRNMQEQTAMVALDDEKRPVGYATWNAPEDAGVPVQITRQSAPFGDHLTLHQKLQKRLEGRKAVSLHKRSARREQTAW